MAVKTTSLETSKMLKEARFRQDTEYHFYRMSSNEKPFIGSRDITWQNYIIFAAPTTDELLEELPRVIQDYTLRIGRYDSEYEIWYQRFAPTP